MRRFVTLLLVAVVAFTAGAVGTNGTLSRLLADIHVGAVPTAPAAPDSPASATPTPTLTTMSQITPSATPPAATSTALLAQPTQVPTPPSALSLAQMRPDGRTLGTGGWTGTGGLSVQVLAPPRAGGLSAEVEVRAVGQAFSGTPTGAATVNQGVATIALHGLAAGQYHWQARLTAAGGAGAWTPFAHGAVAFGVQLTPPPAPQVSSPSDPQPGHTYATSAMTFTWSAPADPSGIAGYSYRLDKDPQGEARQSVRTQTQQATLWGLGSGQYYFHVRAVDGAGNWGPGATFPVRVDVTPPQVTQATFSTYVFNPAVETLRLDYALSKVSRVTVGIYDAANTRVRHIVLTMLMGAGVPLSVTWDGRDNAGKIVPPGTYSIYLRATDRLGNSNVTGWSGFVVTGKRIVVSLTQQQLWAYDGDTLVLTTLVTTGNKALPTPTGLFHIMFAKHPFTFHSPWPKGSPYWYKPSTVQYALYFHDYGYYIHDAPWRGVFGPGSNALSGTPGGNLTGTHGCINVPSNMMQQLYYWATPGTPVEINP